MAIIAKADALRQGDYRVISKFLGLFWSFNLSEVPNSIIPNEVQHHLLKAAVSGVAVATKHWTLLKQQLQLDAIDYGKVEGDGFGSAL